MILNMGGGGVVPIQNLGATTITPGTENQVIPLGTYLRGDLTILGDPDLIPENIRIDRDIFGVNGLSGSGQYVWEKSHIALESVQSNVAEEVWFAGLAKSSTTATVTVYYADSVEYNPDTGLFTLVNPKELTAVVYGSNNNSAFHGLRGKYIIPATNRFSTPTLKTGSTVYYIGTSSAFAYYSGSEGMSAKANTAYKVTMQNVKGDSICFVVSDDVSEYPSGGPHSDGYWYNLLASVASANVMSLTNEALATVQNDYRNQIENEVSGL